MLAERDVFRPSPLPPAIRSATVLIVDDDELVLARLRELVEGAGYLVQTATDSLTALEILKHCRASIVIADIDMPGMDGLTLCRHIRSREWARYIYIVLLTIHDGDQDIIAGLDAGADDYVSKRTPAPQFKARLRTATRVLALEHSLKLAVEHHRRMAMTDALTGVYNRRYFEHHLERELKRSRRFGGRLALMLLDIDRFKQINDSDGHAAGDEVLKTVAAVISALFKRATDWCARIGGDEFAVVLEGATLTQARACAEKLRVSIAGRNMLPDGSPVSVTVSIGIGCVDESTATGAATLAALLARADANLYASKSRGRNCVSPATVDRSNVATLRLIDP